jgi:hypothetical protein
MNLFLHVGRPILREDGPVFCSAHHSLVRVPKDSSSLEGLVPQERGGPVLLPGDSVPFMSPVTTGRVTVEVFCVERAIDHCSLISRTAKKTTLPTILLLLVCSLQR